MQVAPGLHSRALCSNPPSPPFISAPGTPLNPTASAPAIQASQTAPPTMDGATPTKPTGLEKQGSMRYIGSFNDFGSLVAQDMATAPAPITRPVPVPTTAGLAMSAPDRRWSLESDSSITSRSLSSSASMSSSFSQTFKRALYEHMRGN